MKKKSLKIAIYIINIIILLNIFTLNTFAAEWNDDYKTSDRNYKYTGYMYMWSYRENGNTYEERDYRDRYHFNDYIPFKPSGLYTSDKSQVDSDPYIGTASDYGFKTTAAYWEEKNKKRPSDYLKSKGVKWVKMVKTNYIRKMTKPYIENNSIDGATYVDENKYWIKSGTKLNIKLTTYQDFNGNKKGLLDYVKRNAIKLVSDKTEDQMRINRDSNSVDHYVNSGTVPAYFAERTKSDLKGDTNRRLSTSFAIYPQLKDTQYKLYLGTHSFNEGDPGWQDSGKWIATDDTAPTVKDIPSSDWTKNDVNINLSAEDSGSGVKFLNLKVGDKVVSESNSTNYVQSEEGIRNFDYTSEDNVGNKSTGSFTVKIDKTAPTGNVKIENITPFGFDVKISNVTDNGGSGVDVVKVNDIAATNKGNETWSYHFDSNNNFGKTVVKVKAIDKVGNERFLYDSFVNIPYPNPKNGNLKVTKYDYKQNDNNYWVKQNNQFTIYADGYFPSSYNKYYPNKNEIFYAKDGKVPNNCARQYATWNDISGYPMPHYNDYFSIIDDGTRLYTFQKDNKNYSAYEHHAVAKNDGDKFLLYNTNYYVVNGSTHYGAGLQNSGKWLKIDGKAPTGDVLINLDKKTSTIDINAVNVSDNGGSGVKNVWVEISNVDDKSKTKTIQPELSDGNWKTSFNPFDELGTDINKINIEVYAIDNVGNSSNLQSKQFDLFTVTARIVPYDKKQFAGSKPTLKQGQKAIMIITTTGYPEKLDIKFPTELMKLDNKLDTSIKLEPKAYLQTEYVFTVPLKAAMKDYTVNITATKKNQTRSTNPQFTVKDSILDNLRTRRLY